MSRQLNYIENKQILLNQHKSSAKYITQQFIK